MRDPRIARAEELFHAARSLDPAPREALLERSCAGDEQLRALVAGLLAADGSTHALDSPIVPARDETAIFEVLPDRVHIMAEGGERADQIDVARAESARKRAVERMKMVKDEEGFKEAQADYVRAVARLSAANHKGA